LPSPNGTRLAALASLLPLAAAAQSAAQGAPQGAARGAPPPPIEDNSFLVEEAYNQERGVVQHISTFARATTRRAWTYTFTQEWPVPGRTHQLSYTVPIQRPEERGVSPRVGDLLLNYRYQAVAHENLLFAPRLTALLPTGSTSAGTGLGGVGVQTNLPLTAMLTPRLASHSNVGGTLVPRGKTADGDRLRYANLTLAQSFIWLAKPTLNFMLESVYSATSTRVTDAGGGSASPPNDRSLTVAPGVRFAFNFPSGLQIVPGAAIPVTMRGALDSIDADTGVFLYLSFEHSFRK
jgi:hypothetical protein